MSPTAPPSNSPAAGEAAPQLGEPIFPDRLPAPRHLDPATALAFRTPLQEHVLSADGKAAGILTLLGMMFTVLARLGGPLSDLVQARQGPVRYVCAALLFGFAGLSLGAVVQAFRTISPRFPTAPPSLAFFGDIARLSREEYVARVEALSAEEALKQMLAYNHTGSRICVEKLLQLRRGIRFFEFAALSWLLLMAVLGYRVFYSLYSW